MTTKVKFRTFLTFAFVGGIGFVVDAGLLWVLTALYGVDSIVARIPSFLCAVTATWILNSWLTFRSMIFSWLRWLSYASANGLGFLINFSIYALLSIYFSLSPMLSVAIASIIALAVNFILSSKWVFNQTR
jgi:putative flippase GtrA